MKAFSNAYFEESDRTDEAFPMRFAIPLTECVPMASNS